MERLLSLLLMASTATARKVVVLDNSEWDSIVISSPPVKITNSRFNTNNKTSSPKEQDFRYSHPRTARSVMQCEQGDLKCLYDKQLVETSHRNPQDTIERFLEKYASLTNVKINQELANSSSKSYWNQIDSERHKHPYDDAQGWVTLDPIPWSSSTVSRWKPNNQGDKPWDYAPPSHSWPQHPSSPYPPPSTSSWPQPSSSHDHHPSSGSWHQHSSSSYPSSGSWPQGPPTSHPLASSWPPQSSASWGVGTNGIITDNKPSSFPLDNGYDSKPNGYSNGPSEIERPEHTSHPYPQYQPPTHPQQYQPVKHPQQIPYGQKPSYWSSTSRPSYQWQDNKIPGYSTDTDTAGGSSASSSHPNTYPGSGQGEWVLLSTTKGYSVPQRYHDRKMHVRQMISTQNPPTDITSRSVRSKYQENDIDDKFMLLSSTTNENRKSDKLPEIGEPLWSVDGVDIFKTNVVEQAREAKTSDNSARKREMTMKRTVRLTVLPALNNSSTTSHDGMLEVHVNPQSVDEAQKEAEKLKKLEKLAVVTTNGGRQHHRVTAAMLPPTTTTNVQHIGNAGRKAAVFAAVSAGMIPATMAILLPAALGRRRRSTRAEERQ